MDTFDGEIAGTRVKHLEWMRLDYQDVMTVLDEPGDIWFVFAGGYDGLDWSASLDGFQFRVVKSDLKEAVEEFGDIPSYWVMLRPDGDYGMWVEFDD